MSTPHFVAKRVGDQYLLVPTTVAGTANTCARPELLVGGAALALAAAVWPGRTRWGLLALGGAVLAAWYGCDRTGRRRARTGGREVSAITHGPSFPRQSDGPAGQTAREHQPPADAVDEAGMESFPASDPPAHMTPSQAS